MGQALEGLQPENLLPELEPTSLLILLGETGDMNSVGSPCSHHFMYLPPLPHVPSLNLVMA